MTYLTHQAVPVPPRSASAIVSLMLAPLVAFALISSLQEMSKTPATPIVRIISKAHGNDAVAILVSTPQPVKVRFVYVGKLGADDADTYFFNQIVSLFAATQGRWKMTGIREASQKDAGTSLAHGIGCSAVNVDGEGGKIISRAMATAGYPCSHEAAGYTPLPKPTEPSGRRALIPHTPVEEVVISIGK